MTNLVLSATSCVFHGYQSIAEVSQPQSSNVSVLPLPKPSGLGVPKVGQSIYLKSSTCAAWLHARRSRAGDCRRDRQRALTVCSANEANDAVADTSSLPPLPLGPKEVVRQAVEGVKRGLAEGKTRHLVDLLLPLIGATDLDDWPGGIQQQFKAIQPMVNSLMVGLLGDDQAASLNNYIIDGGDAVVAWEGDALAAVVFATGDSLPRIMEIAAKKPERPLLLINVQWQQSQQVVSDFGIGKQRAVAEEFVASFCQVYSLKQTRIKGRNMSLLYQYGGPWQIIVMEDNGRVKGTPILEPERPSYRRIEELLKGQPGGGEQGLFKRLMTEFKFNQDSLKSKE